MKLIKKTIIVIGLTTCSIAFAACSQSSPLGNDGGQAVDEVVKQYVGVSKNLYKFFYGHDASMTADVRYGRLFLSDGTDGIPVNTVVHSVRITTSIGQLKGGTLDVGFYKDSSGKWVCDNLGNLNVPFQAGDPTISPTPAPTPKQLTLKDATRMGKEYIENNPFTVDDYDCLMTVGRGVAIKGGVSPQDQYAFSVQFYLGAHLRILGAS